MRLSSRATHAPPPLLRCACARMYVCIHAQCRVPRQRRVPGILLHSVLRGESSGVVAGLSRLLSSACPTSHVVLARPTARAAAADPRCVV